MTTTAAAFILGVAFGLAGYSWLSLPERRRTAWELARAEEMAARNFAQRCRFEGLYRDKAAEHAALSGVVDAATVRAAHDALRETPAFFAAKVLSEDERAWDSEVFGA